MEIFARHYETLRVSYDKVYEEVNVVVVYLRTMKRRNFKKDNRGKLSHFFNLNIKFGPSCKRKHSQVRVKYW